jgi:carboxyl-terminal processing protease
MRASFIKVRNVFISIIFLVGIFGAGYYFGLNGYKAEVQKSLNVTISREVPPEKDVDFNLFWQVWDLLLQKYYDKNKLVPVQMVEGAISGMVSALGDPYTMFLPAKTNKIVDDDLKGKLEGVGIEIGYKSTNLAVISPLSGSPAEKAGVRAGDLILRIKDEKKNVDIDTAGISISDAVNNIRGTAGTTVTLTLFREGKDKPFTVDIVRDTINIPSVAMEWVGDKNIAHVKILKFGAETVSEWDKAVREITDKKDVKGIILDVRNDPGGYLQAAIDIASDFVKNDTTVVIQENGDLTRHEFKSTRLPRLLGYKVVILVNGGSASASEILSGALRDQAKVKLIGDKSFGKGTIQEPVEISGGAGLHVTVAKWLTPNGTWVHGKGLEPDIVIDMPLDEANVKTKVESMRNNGMIQDVTVWLQDMRIIDGFHRTEAARRLALPAIRCKVVDCSEAAFWDARIKLKLLRILDEF